MSILREILLNETCFCAISTHEWVDNIGLQNTVLTVNHGQECKRNNQNVLTKKWKI